MKNLKIVVVLALSVSVALAQVYPAGGRLSLTSNTPVMTSDVTGATTVYYVPYTGNNVPYSTGASLVNGYFGTQLTLTLNSGLTSGSIYDVFLNYITTNGTLVLCTGPAWNSSTSRGTGAGTTQLTTLDGLPVNAYTMSSSCLNGSTSYSVSANAGVYLGSVYITATGETGVSMQPAGANGGSNNIIGLFNAYNRVKAYARSIDTTSSGWTYSSTTVREANNSASNRISFLDGLGVIPISAQYIAGINPNSNNGLLGVGINSTTAFTDPPAYFGSTNAFQASPGGMGFSYPIIGFNYVQALEANSNTGVISYGVSETPTLYATLEY